MQRAGIKPDTVAWNSSLEVRVIEPFETIFEWFQQWFQCWNPLGLSGIISACARSGRNSKDREWLNDWDIEFQDVSSICQSEGALADRMKIPEDTRSTYTQSHSINEFTEKNSAGMDEPRKLKCGWAGAFGWTVSKSWFMSSNKLVEWPGQRWDGSIWDEARCGFLQHRHQHLCKIWSSSRGQCR